MKSAASPARRVAARAPARLQRKAASASVHRDSREAQADDRGMRFARGGTNLAQGLSPVAAAGFGDPRSVGEPLAPRLKADLENAFNADLDAVRIHRDAPARSAAMRFGASAFASGTAIYFSDNAFDPDTMGGRALIGHELAHVLQQTGRASARRPIAARPLLGSGLIQCAPPTSAETEAHQKFLFEDLVRIHRGGNVPTGDLDLEDAIELARSLTDGKLVDNLSKPAFSAPLNTAAETGKLTKFKSTRSRSFLFDTLKVLGWFPEAAKMIASDDGFKLHTFSPVGQFMEFLQTNPAYGRAWLTPWLSHDLFKTTWPEMVLKGWRSFYLRPTFVPGRDKALTDRLTAVFANIDKHRIDAPPTLRTDAYWLVWDLIGKLDDERITTQYALREKLLKMTGGDASIFDAIAAQLPIWREEALATGQNEQAAGHERSIAAGLIPLIDEASAYWKKVLGDYSAWKSAWNIGDEVLTDPAASVPSARYAGTAAEPLHASFASAVANLFETARGADSMILVPGAAEYRQKLDSFVAALSSVYLPTSKAGEQPLTWIDSLQAIALAEATAKTPDPARLSELAILPLVFSDMIGMTARYNAKSDQDSPHFDDQRRAHRLRMARWVATIARWLSWSDLLTPLAPIFDAAEGVDPDMTGMARLMLVSDWEPDSVRPIADMLVDFPEKADLPVLQDAPFSLRVIVEWFRYDYHHRLGDVLRSLLSAETSLSRETRFDLDPLTHIRQTRGEIRRAMAATAEAEYKISDAAAFPLKIPQRFIVKDFDLVVPKDATVDFFDLLLWHEKTQQQLARRAPGIMLPTKPSGGAFAWLLPPLDGLAAMMLKIPSIATIVARETGETDAAWYKRLAPAGENSAAGERHLSTDDIAKLNETLLKWIDKFGENEEKQIPDLWRRWIILRRRYIALVLIPRIDLFAEHSYVSHGPLGETNQQMAGRLETPDRVIQYMRSFEGMARPMREHSVGQGAEADAAEREAIQLSADAQTALLTFALAPSLLKLDPNAIKWDLKQHLYEYFQLAIDYAEDAKKLRAMRDGLGTDDEAAAQIIPDGRRADLVKGMKAFMTAFEEEVARSQTERGFKSENGVSILPNASHFPEEIKPGKPGLNEWRTNQELTEAGKLNDETGDKWRLVKVYFKFEYHPAAGGGAAPGMRKGAGGPVAPARMVIWRSGQPVEYFAPNLPDDILFRYSFNDTEYDVKANDTYHLDQLADVFLWRAIQLTMESLASTIMTFVDWSQTVAALFFPEAAIAEFAMSMAQMFESGEFDDTIAMLKDDPIGFAQHALARLTTDLFNPTNIWKFVLLGSQHSPLYALQDHKPAARKAKPTGKLGRVVAVLRTLGARFEGAMHRVHEYTQPPFRRAQGKIAMHPTLVWLLQRASRLVTTIYELIPVDKIEEAKGKDGPAYLDAFRTMVSGENIEEEFKGRIVELFEGIQHVELPGELIDVAPAIELILGFILSKFGSRGKILRVLLSTMPVPDNWASEGKKATFTNALAFISTRIRDYWIKGTALDPNTYWQTYILPIVGTKFDEIRDDLVDGLYEAADGVLKVLDLKPLKRPAKSELPNAEVVKEPLMSEGEASLTGGAAPRIGRPRLAATGGTPLGRASRGRFERALGADLSHVRVHTNAAAATRPIRANALTSGSHVYLSPGIASTQPSGQRLMAHELTHVVQQTGPRGPGRAGARMPTMGRPGIGVRHEPQRERVADQVAAHVGSGRRVPASLRRSIGSFQGIQPSIEAELATSVLSELSKADAKSFTEDLVGGKDPEGFAAAKALSDQVLGMLRDNKNVHFADFMQDTSAGPKVSDLILTHMNNRITDVRGFALEIKRVAQLGQKPRKKTAEDEPDTELNPKAFVQLLANYLFATCNVAIKIDHDAAVKTIEKITLFNLNIAEVGGTSVLWKRAMENSFSIATVDDMEKAQREMRERLRDLGPQPSIWASTQFAFRHGVIDDYLALLKTRKLGSLDDVPTVAEYKNKDSPKGDGLAIATHGELTKQSRSIGTYERESHHTSQYLLIEYFSNHPEASRKAFPGSNAAELQADFAPAGVNINSEGIVEEIQGIGDPIQIAKLNPNTNRGAEMPAILISARCHQRGELHILRSSRWNGVSDENIGTSTQGYAIENEFNKSLPAELRPRERADSKAKRDDLRAYIAGHPLQAKTGYYKAALATYKWMNDHMIGALSEGLLREEYAYYRGIAARKHMNADGTTMNAAYDLKPADLVQVHLDAKANNEKVMSRYNWKAS